MHTYGQTHTHAYIHTHDSGPSLNSCHDNVRYPIIPKHIADFLKIMCVVFSSRLLSRRPPSEQIHVRYKVILWKYSLELWITTREINDWCILFSGLLNFVAISISTFAMTAGWWPERQSSQSLHEAQWLNCSGSVLCWRLKWDMEHRGDINTADFHPDRESEGYVEGAERQIKDMSATAPTTEQTASSWMWLLQWYNQIVYLGEIRPVYSGNHLHLCHYYGFTCMIHTNTDISAEAHANYCI